MSRKKKALIGMAAVLVVIMAAGFWAVWPRSWDGLTGRQQPTSIAGMLAVHTYDVVDQEPSLGADIWTLSAEQTEGPAAEAILAALNSGIYRGRLRNIVSYTLFRPANSSYSIDGEDSKGEVDLILVDDAQTAISLTVFNGGMITLRDHSSSAGMLFFDTDPQVYEALSAVFKEYGTLQEN